MYEVVRAVRSRSVWLVVSMTWWDIIFLIPFKFSNRPRAGELVKCNIYAILQPFYVVHFCQNGLLVLKLLSINAMFIEVSQLTGDWPKCCILTRGKTDVLIVFVTFFCHFFVVIIYKRSVIDESMLMAVNELTVGLCQRTVWKCWPST